MPRYLFNVDTPSLEFRDKLRDKFAIAKNHLQIEKDDSEIQYHKVLEHILDFYLNSKKKQ